MKDPELPELLLQTTLDAHQAAHLTGLPVALVRGCEDVLTGATLDADALRALSDADRADYGRGQRLADAWFYAADAAADAAYAERWAECDALARTAAAEQADPLPVARDDEIPF